MSHALSPESRRAGCTDTKSWDEYDDDALAHGHISKIVVNTVNRPAGGTKIGFRAVSRSLAGWDGAKMGPEWSRTLPGASQTPLDPNSLDFLAQIPILTFSSTKFAYK